MIVIIDAGHGVETLGKRSPGKVTPDDGRPGIVEYHFNRRVAQFLADALEEMDIPYHLICQDENSLRIAERVQIANTMIKAWEGHAMFMSIHSNAAGPGGWYSKARGVRTFTRMNAKAPSKALATLALKNISRISGLRKLNVKDHIVRKGKKVPLGVLTRIKAPAILTENGFMTSRADCELLASEKGQRLIAEGHLQTVLDFQNWIAGVK